MKPDHPHDERFAQGRFVRRFIEGMPVTQDLGIRVDDLTPGRTVMSLPVADRHTLDGSTVQAGITAMLADFAAVAAAATILPDGWLAATTGFSVHHLAPARGPLLVAMGSVVKESRRSLVARADVYAKTGSERLHCLTGLFTATGISPDPG